MLLYVASHKLDAIRFISLCSQFVQFSWVLSHVHLFAMPWTAGCQVPYLSPTPRDFSSSCPLSWWCHPNISSSVFPFSSCFQSFLTSGSFPIESVLPNRWANNWSFNLALVLPVDILDWFPLRWTYLISLQSKGLQDSLKNLLQREELRWHRNRTGRPLSPPQIHQKIIGMLSKLLKTNSDL